jgi:hypothetical protein
MRKVALSLAIIGLALPLLAASPAQAQAARTWVSGTGNDGNTASNCSRTSPCRSLSVAMSVTYAGGEINCLDPGEFVIESQQLIITKSLIISCEAGTASVYSIAVNGSTNDVVTLRGLDFDGFQVAGSGILVSGAKEVHIEKCSIRGYTTAGIATDPNSSTTVFLYIVDTVISANYGGIWLPSAGGFKVATLKNVIITGARADGLSLASSNVYANVVDSVISGNSGSAVVTLASSTTANIERSTIANNSVAGLYAAASGSSIRATGNGIYNNTYGVLIAQGAAIQSDGTNKHGNSNGGVQVPNGVLAQY